jgi:hypothetical protein
MRFRRDNLAASLGSCRVALTTRAPHRGEVATGGKIVVRGAGAILKARINLSSSILRWQTASLMAKTAGEITSGK